MTAWTTLRHEPGTLHLLDQRLLPQQEVEVALESAEAVAEAIEALVVRGAPAIGCAAAYALAVEAYRQRDSPLPTLRTALEVASERLRRTRPTAVNLFWALERMGVRIAAACAAPGATGRSVSDAVTGAAREIEREDARACRALGEAGATLVPDGARVLTHCNAGALATAGIGTALGIVRAAHERDPGISVFAGETRPFLQGARLTAWELARDGIPVTVVTDNMTGHLMQCGEIDLVIVGADRIARNGDVANKIGTYALAVLAHHHGIPFYVAAPRTTIDPDTPDGASIPLESRGRAEVAELGGRTLVPEGVPVRHPAFDVTPAALVGAIVTEVGVARAPYEASLSALLDAPAA